RRRKTTSRSYRWTLRHVTSPTRAIATTSRSTGCQLPSSSVRTRGISALSSTTRTLGRVSDDDGIGAHRPDLDAPVRHVEEDGPALVPPHGLARDGDRGGAERIARRDGVALPPVHRPGPQHPPETPRP